MVDTDYYELLQVERSADERAIKSAYRRLAMECHPDRNPGCDTADHKFKELNEAYDVLKDGQKRAAYDRFGESAFRPGAGPSPDFGGIEDLFGDLLGAFGFRNGGDKGAIRKSIQLTFEEAAHGCEKEVSYERVDLCGRCSGAGGEPDSTSDTCNACGGRGKVRFQQALFPLAVERPCSRCRGRGRVPRETCTACSGAGLAKQTRRLQIEIPAGIEAGAVRTVDGAGNRVRPDKPAGDLEIVVEVAQHAFFRRVGDDVVCRIPITFSQATLGGEVSVPTLEGTARLRIPPATQVGSVLRLRGKGIAHRVRSGNGDQLVEVTIQVPSQLSDRARELIEQLGAELGETVLPQEPSFMEKLKGLFG